ncbi:MAG: hypothetical protein CVU57_21190 [Deltaproteobacteria bacterium HGW-Deltaproteobacteria-15]|nr:MAG: hypothetical protein CVU57_21190 [Deltaproteobacteria bacterium HGW-Deltaproteobacteria-15]
MKVGILLSGAFAVLLAGCATWNVPSTLGDPRTAQSYGYHPMDPLPVDVKYDGTLTNARLMRALPDETMRLAVGEISGGGGITYGPATAGYKGRSYVVVLDYIKFNTKSFGVKLSSEPRGRKATLLRGANGSIVPDVIVPVYVGVGLRLTANVTVHEGSVNLGSLFGLGLAAEAKQISGTLVVQTLGVSGESISTIIPMPAEINSSTIQNAILALGAIKAKMYETDTDIAPRVVGVYNNLGGGTETINGFISSLLQEQQFLIIK